MREAASEEAAWKAALAAAGRDRGGRPDMAWQKKGAQRWTEYR